MMQLDALVDTTLDATEDIRVLRLTRADGGRFGPYVPGAHIDVVGPTGITRQYSLCGHPADGDAYTIAVKREAASRGGSEALHSLAVGDTVRISAPRSILSIAPDADRHVLVAGGIGITPLMSMAFALADAGADFELHYFLSSRASGAFLDDLERHPTIGPALRVHAGVGRAAHRDVLSGHVVPGLTERTAVYTCGPEGLMQEVIGCAVPVVGDNGIHVEHFAAIATERDESDTAFTVALDTGEEFEIPADRSILSVLEDNGIEVFKSCTEGICGSCVSGVLEGDVDHRDQCLSASDRAAGNQMALCVSRARSPRLVIELY